MLSPAVPVAAPSQPPAPKLTRHHEPKVTGKVLVALQAMVWDGLPRKQAAAHAGLTEHGLYKALRKPVVKAFYLAELEVLRTSEKACSIHRMVAIRDAADNMPAFQAARYLLEDSDTPARSMGSVALPGLTIQIITQSADVHAHTPQAPNVGQVIDNADGGST